MVKIARELYLNEAENFAKNLFFENPFLSIDDAARQIYASCQRSLVKTAISDIRREVRQKIGIEDMPKHRPNTQTVNPPAPVAPAPQAVEPEAVVSPISTKQERSDFLNTWAQANPMATIAQARQALMDKFNQAMGTSYISETMKLARQIYEENQRVAGVKPKLETPAEPDTVKPTFETPKGIAVLARTLQQMGIRSIAINDDGTYNVELKGSLTEG